MLLCSKCHHPPLVLLIFAIFACPILPNAAVVEDLPQVVPYPCDMAPDLPSEKSCIMLLQWYREAEELIINNKTSSLRIPPSPAISVRSNFLPSYANGIYSCLSLDCLCRHFNGKGDISLVDGECQLEDGNAVNKATRKEIRMLKEEERNAFFAALHDFKFQPNSSEYARLVQYHSEYGQNYGAHGGPGFLPWHREYLKRFEIGLRYMNFSVAIPYWDTTLESHLEDPSYSILWTDEFLGAVDGDGLLQDGPFKGWTALDETDSEKIIVPLKRQPGTTPKGLFSEKDIDNFAELDFYGFFGAPLAPLQEGACPIRSHFTELEPRHGGVHTWFGGQIANIATAANDPLFWMYHAFVDKIWEDWRQEKQNETQREEHYPDSELIKKCAGSVSEWHFLESEMKPFGPNTKNKDGLDNGYTGRMYEYAPRPTCYQHKGCDSPYLFCDREDGMHKCVAKMREGGPCGKYGEKSENPCYKGKCVDGKCKNDGEQQLNRNAVDNVNEGMSAEKKRNCLNNHECCGMWAQKGFCEEKAKHMRVWCMASCGFDHCAALDYELADDCTDRHHHCRFWSGDFDGHRECEANPLWMAENCRKSCQLCSKKREEKCRDYVPNEF